MKDTKITEKLHMQFYKCNKLLKRNAFEHRLEHIKATPYKGQGRILKLLLDNGEMSQKDIVIEMDIRPSTVWELVGKLERAGFVEKIPNPEDKRGTIVRLTEAGKKEAVSAKWDLNNISTELYSVLSEEEQLKLSELLGKLIASLKKTEEDIELENDFDFYEGGEGGRFDDKIRKCFDSNIKSDFRESVQFFKEFFRDIGIKKKTSKKDKESNTDDSEDNGDIESVEIEIVLNKDAAEDSEKPRKANKSKKEGKDSQE